MKTTIEIPDALLERAKVASARRKITLKQLVIEGLEKAISETASTAPAGLTPEQAKVFEICELGYPALKTREVPAPEIFLARIEALRDELGA